MRTRTVDVLTVAKVAMIELLTSPWNKQLNEVIESADSSLLVCAPYVGRGPCERLSSTMRRGNSGRPIDLFMLTDLSRDNMLSGATDVGAIASLVEALPQAVVRILPSLHAKVYIADSRIAVVTSANFTDNGLWRNFEDGVLVKDPIQVSRIREDILTYGELGSVVTLPQLRAFAAAADDLRSTRASAMASLRRKLRVEFDKKIDAMDEAVLRARAGDRSLDAILSDAILYLLRNQGMTTPEIHRAIQQIHPDLCDDSIDRVINGRHFGKKWKHAVRRAQYHLKQRGSIRLAGRVWTTVK